MNKLTNLNLVEKSVSILFQQQNYQQYPKKPHACHLCNFRAEKYANLKIHLRIHTGEKPFACHLCQYRCNQSSNLNAHIRKKHKVLLPLDSYRQWSWNLAMSELYCFRPLRRRNVLNAPKWWTVWIRTLRITLLLHKKLRSLAGTARKSLILRTTW